jgi:hypothetical protein
LRNFKNISLSLAVAAALTLGGCAAGTTDETTDGDGDNTGGDTTSGFTSTLISGKTFYGDGGSKILFSSTQISGINLANSDDTWQDTYTISDGKLIVTDDDGDSSEVTFVSETSTYIEATIENEKTIKLYKTEAALIASLDKITSTSSASKADTSGDSEGTHNGFDITNIKAEKVGDDIKLTLTTAGDLLDAVGTNPPADSEHYVWISINQEYEFAVGTNGVFFIKDSDESSVDNSLYTYGSSGTTSYIQFSKSLLTTSNDYLNVYVDSGTWSDTVDEVDYDEAELLANISDFDSTTTTTSVSESDLYGSWEIYNGSNLDQLYACADITNDGKETVYFPNSSSIVNTWSLNSNNELELYNNGTYLQKAIFNEVSISEVSVTCQFSNGSSESRKLSKVSNCDAYKADTGDTDPSNSDNSSVYSLSDLAGSWNGYSFYTPSSGSSVSSYLVDKSHYEVTSTGATTQTMDGESDTYNVSIHSETGKQTLTIGSVAIEMEAYMNAGKDLRVWVAEDEDESDQRLGTSVKTANSYAISDLSGIWKGIEMHTPDETNYTDGNEFFVSTSTATIDSSGNASFTGDYRSDGDLKNGTVQFSNISSNGELLVGSTQTNLFLSAKKDVMIQAQIDEEDGTIWGQFYSIKVKQATSYTQSDLEGTWHALSFSTPTHGSNDTAELGYSSDTITISGTTFAIQNEDTNDAEDLGHTNSFTNPMTISTNGTISGNPLGDSGITEYTFMNASKDVIIYVSDDSETQGVSVWLKQAE